MDTKWKLKLELPIWNLKLNASNLEVPNFRVLDDPIECALLQKFLSQNLKVLKVLKSSSQSFP